MGPLTDLDMTVETIETEDATIGKSVGTIGTGMIESADLLEDMMIDHQSERETGSDIVLT